MRFLIDANLPTQLAQVVVGNGFEALHVADITLVSARDNVLWDYAETTGAIIITRDRDFASRRKGSQTGPRIIWYRCGNMRFSELVEWFQKLFPVALLLLEQGEALIELTIPSDGRLIPFQSED